MKEQFITKVDFDYSFGTPHRLCICLPNSSKKSLLDATETGLTISWGDGDLTTRPMAAYKPVQVDWSIVFTAEADGVLMNGKSWNRVEEWIPALEYQWAEKDVCLKITAVATKDADVFKVEVKNLSDERKKVGLYGNPKIMMMNTRWIDFDSPYNALLAHVYERPDRLFMLAVQRTATPQRAMSGICMEWELESGTSEVSYLIRPYYALKDEIVSLLDRDWELAVSDGISEWKKLRQRAPIIKLPDIMVENAYYACLADQFVMREKQIDGRFAGACGTDVYRACNSFEPCFQAAALNKAGFLEEARDNIEFVIQSQEKDGNWEDERSWTHHMWGSSGTKSNAIREHYLFTQDKDFLASAFERMLASARWSQRQRTKTKIMDKNGKKTATWGLMPRGMGDCGLADGDDIFGVFYPHNFLHCMGLEIAVWTAKELGRNDVEEELNGYYQDLHQCLLDSLELGAISEPDGSRWIPGTPGKTCGSRWGVAEAVYPCRILPAHHPLADGTMAMLERKISKGGLPMDLGWLKQGLWVAIALDAIAYSNMQRGEADKAANYLYPTLNHGTPLFSWCEERSEEKGTKTVTGDLQHAWTPISVARFIRDCLVMEDGSELHITRATPREWLDIGQDISIEKAPTYWGKLGFRVCREDIDHVSLALTIDNKNEKSIPQRIVFHPRVQDGGTWKISRSSGGDAEVSEEKIMIRPKAATITLLLERE